MKDIKNTVTNPGSTNLRTKALDKLNISTSLNEQTSVNSELDSLKLIYELQVHQIELEMQNEELIIAKEKAELAERKYSKFYEFSPASYFTLTKEGTIFELNQSGAKMLGKLRSNLINSKFGFFVTDLTKSIFNDFLSKVFIGNLLVSCEISLSTGSKSNKYIHLSGIINENKEQCLLTAIDITDRKIAEEALEESEEKYRLLFVNLTNGFSLQEAIFDEYGNAVDFRFIETNKYYENFSGFTSNFIKGKTMKEVIPNADMNMIKNYCDVAITGKPLELEYYSQSFNKHIKVNCYSPQKGFFASIFEDISERINAEEKIKKQSALINPLLDSIPDIIFYKDLNGVYLGCNPAFAEVTGKSKEDIIGKTDFDLFDREIAEFFREQDKLMIKSLKYRQNEELVEYPDGRKVSLETLKTPYFASDGQVIGLIGVSRDITENNKIAKALKESELQYRSLSENSPDLIMRFDREYRHLYANNASADFFGIDRDDFIGKTHKELGFAKNEYDYWHSKIEDVFLSGKASNEVTSILDGKFWMDWKIIPEFDSYGNVTSVLSLTRDITDLMIAEIELNKSNEELSESKQAIEKSLFGKNLLIQELSEVRDKLQIANNEKDKFFSIIAHDLKGPFSGFLGLTKIMVEDLNSFSINEIVEMNVLMKDSASNLYKLLENLLEWSLSQKGVTSFNPENCILGYIVNQIFAFMLNMAKAKEITLVNNILEEQYVTADIPMLNTIIRNLISNAIKFTPNGGMIEIGTIDQPSEGSIVIYVKDSGMGMSDEIKEKLFKIDSKITNVGTNNEKGTGLGLILCKEFIGKHGGRIWVESEIGKGSTFNFSLPIK